jgi:serine protease Do
MTSKKPLPALRKRFIVAVAAVAFAGLAGLVPAGPEAYAQRGPESVADLAEGLLDAVVNVSTSQRGPAGQGPGTVPMPDVPEGSPFQDYFDEFFNNPEGNGAPPRRMQSLGSGFVVDAEQGIVITNNHVIADSDEVEINFTDGSTLTAEVVGRDTKTDIAVLKVDPGDKRLKAVPFGDSGKMRTGDWVMAIGNPFGLGNTVTVGIISALDRDINSGPYDDFIQTDAAINRGNSGGPLFNMDGEVIGINTAIISPTGGSIGIGFAIPTDLALGVIDQLREFGETRRGWLGVRIQPVTDDISESLGLSGTRGAVVAGIIKGGPVDDGSIRAGDVILKFDGRDILTMRDLPRIVADTEVGKAVDVVIMRDGKEQTVKVTLGRLEDGERLASAEGEVDETSPDGDAVSTAKVFGMTIAELDDDARANFGISSDISGVVITEVQENSPAAERGIEPGLVITELGQESVSSPQDVLDRVAALKAQGRKSAVMIVAAKTGELRFVSLRMD